MKTNTIVQVKQTLQRMRGFLTLKNIMTRILEMMKGMRYPHRKSSAMKKMIHETRSQNHIDAEDLLLKDPLLPVLLLPHSSISKQNTPRPSPMRNLAFPSRNIEVVELKTTVRTQNMMLLSYLTPHRNAATEPLRNLQLVPTPECLKPWRTLLGDQSRRKSKPWSKSKRRKFINSREITGITFSL